MKRVVIEINIDELIVFWNTYRIQKVVDIDTFDKLLNTVICLEELKKLKELGIVKIGIDK